jgi:excisionase family DNA binding protein
VANALWFTPKLAAQYCQVDVVTLRRAVQRGDLKAFKVNGGTRIRYRAVDLDAWLESHPVGRVAS